ncbi:MAG TPA: ABC transporter permease [Candidatus Kapabacteria bacterium]|nr:ABC transporter permease [Candidatus Kapabacteria bacterium]
MAIQSILANKLRASLTLLSMAIGVFAIVGVAAAVGALDGKLQKQLESFGSTSFLISRTPVINFGDSWRRYRNRKDITVRQAQELQRRLTSAEMVSLQNQTMGVVAKHEGNSTDPNVFVYGSDDAWMTLSDYDLASGRNLTSADVEFGSDLAVIGDEIAHKIFKDEAPLGKSLTLNGHRYTVVGVFAPKGAIFGQSRDAIVLVPITSAMKYFFDEWESSVYIHVRAPSTKEFDNVLGQAVGILRALRGVESWEPNDFEINTNESIMDTFSGLTQYVSYFGLGCGIIALVAAGVGIMNIMLVSVKERTREIGIRKAIGATSGNILSQFIIEAITICQLGAFIGIGLGLLGGVGLAGAMDATVPFPWQWAAGAIAACTMIGLLFGSYPAWKASRLDPIDALRYE